VSVRVHVCMFLCGERLRGFDVIISNFRCAEFEISNYYVCDLIRPSEHVGADGVGICCFVCSIISFSICTRVVYVCMCMWYSVVRAFGVLEKDS